MIHAEHLEFSYRKNKKIFSGLDLTLTQGHVYGLLGKNGAGKSTLLKLLCGLLFPDNGVLTVMGYTPRQRKPSFLSDLFFIPEEIYLPEMKIQDYGKLIAPFYPHFDAGQLGAYMEEFEVSDKEKLNRMSYGQRKKALISLGLACNTRFLIMDEPTNGLDIPSKSHFRRVISSVTTDERCVIISTHQVRDLENLIDAIVVIDESQILVNTTTDKITEKLTFRALKENEFALFAEDSLKGRWGVVPNENGEESKMDMELFFNAVLENPQRLKQMFD